MVWFCTTRVTNWIVANHTASCSLGLHCTTAASATVLIVRMRICTRMITVLFPSILACSTKLIVQMMAGNFDPSAIGSGHSF